MNPIAPTATRVDPPTAAAARAGAGSSRHGTGRGRVGVVALALLVFAGPLACSSYTAYLLLDPLESDEPHLDDRQRDQAIAILDQVVREYGFITDPNVLRLQRSSVRSVESNYNVLASYVPRRSVTGQRITVSAVTSKFDQRFGIRIRNLDSEVATPLVSRIQSALTQAYLERFPGHAIEIEQLRWGPPRGST